MTGNGRGFGFVTFSDSKGACPECLFDESSCMSCLENGLSREKIRNFDLVLVLFFSVADSVVAQRHEIRGRTVGARTREAKLAIVENSQEPFSFRRGERVLSTLGQ